MTEGDRVAWLMLDGWAGRTNHTVIVAGETAKFYRIRRPANAKPLKVPGARRRGNVSRLLTEDRVATVPKYAVTFRRPKQVDS